MTDLIERLRTRNGRADGFGLGPVCDEAADELSALRAERDALVKTLAASCVEEREQLWEATTGGGCSRAIAAEAERDALRADANIAESELEAAHSALQEWAAEDIDVPACVQEALDHLNTALEKVRGHAARAALKGE